MHEVVKSVATACIAFETGENPRVIFTLRLLRIAPTGAKSAAIRLKTSDFRGFFRGVDLSQNPANKDLGLCHYSCAGVAAGRQKKSIHDFSGQEVQKGMT